MTFADRLKNAGNAARPPKLNAGNHKLALADFRSQDTRQYGPGARFATFVVLESNTHEVGSMVAASWFVNDPNPTKADKQLAKYRDFLVAAANSSDVTKLEEYDVQLKDAAQYGKGLQVIANCTQETFPQPYVKTTWQAVPQTPEQLVATRKMLEASEPANAAAPAAKPSLLGGLSLK